MCGILGLLDPNASPSMWAELGLLAHRGPDDSGVHSDADVFLGACRLSIIDVAGGRQPLSNEDGTVWAAQNGEIYNYLDVRAVLESRGHVFRTRSDTEVIVHAYETWGAACAKHLRGIFAFAVWDAPRRRLLLARDRFGVKPLYYVKLLDGALAFASEVRPLLGRLPGRPAADLTGLRAIFDYGFIPTPRTAFAGIRKLPAAHTLLVEDGRVSLARYWDLPAPDPADGVAGRAKRPADDVVDGFRQHLGRIVSEQRMSEVPLGALISGGLDSAAVAALLQAEVDEPVHTFNIGFDDTAYDETRYAALAAKHIGTQHHQITFSEADFDLYPDALAHLEEPQCSATALPIYRLYHACRQARLKVILTGEGADELLGGYHWYRGDQQAQRLAWLPRPLRRFLAAQRLPISPAGRRVLAAGEPDLARRYALWHSVGPVAGLLGPNLRHERSVIPEWQAALAAAADGRDTFRQLQYLETHTRLPDFLNFEVDRMSMAHGIEARVPFLDHLLWEYTARLPGAALLAGRQPKDLLRRAVGGLLPPQVLARPKRGLAAPYAAWLRRHRLPDWAEAALTDRALSATGYFDPAALRRLRAEHQSGARNHGPVLMGVLSTQMWHAMFIEG